MKPSLKLAPAALIALPLFVLLVLPAGCEKTDPTAPDMSTLELSANPDSVDLAIGETDGTSIITATVLDSNGRPVSDINVTFQTNNGNFSGATSISQKSDSHGESTAVLRLNQKDSDATVTVRAAGTSNATITVPLNLPGENAAPTATITPSTIPATLNTIVSFTGANSTDTDGVIVRYDWSFGDGTPDVTNNTTPGITHTYARSGTFTVVLTVYDDGDGTNCDATTHLCHDTKQRTGQAMANVTNPAPTAIINNGDFTTPVATPVILDGSGSHDNNPMGSISQYQWSFGDGGSATLTIPTVAHTFLTTGTFTVTLTVSDNGDGTSDVKTASTTVRATVQ